MKNSICFVILVLIFGQLQADTDNPPAPRSYFTIRVYHFINDTQEKRLDSFLRDGLLPALQRQGIKKTGVFKPVANDTAADKRIFVLIPFNDAEQMAQLPTRLEKDKVYTNSTASFIGAAFNDAPYTRMEAIFLYAFELMPEAEAPLLKGPTQQRIYELRSYESATDNLFRNKVKMFNAGGEIALFRRLGFNAVFYGEVLAGPRMPNLMYITSFENMEARNEHWKTFSNDPEWKKLSPLPEYKNNVSKIDIILMHPAAYSQL
jgi:hypothetical protein